ncbi:hypothetical protein QWY85_07620 [Neolewinella lacunae]|uniref:Uncharacterized protein n=1 Tax=Neolewinella lacunae TaxID=1517758 RepID=A0A923TDB3_9BACT|nr:hypothetical protein [Neolewinella lacunae]MBC6994647.1 hypothetical protein [Neolewinella lacunae]MDN3634519.1 hypothetical protein [Neolewinella lacunae]
MSKTIANPINDLREIRLLMERSRYFIGLSGLSGIGAGAFALLGVAATVAYQWAGGQELVFISRSLELSSAHPWGIAPLPFLALTGSLVLLGALACGYYFTGRRARRLGQTLLDKKALKLIFHLMVPLVVGGVFCLGLIYQEHGGLIGPATLIFYGLALLNASGYAREEVSYLGYLEVLLGLISCFFIGYGLYFWAFGFGVLHIVYGTWMYRKYDRV